MRQVVAGIIIHNDKILIGKKVEKVGHFVSGGWHLPGGYMEGQEDEITALKREIKEETNLEIEIISKITKHTIPESSVTIHWYECKSLSCDVEPGDDLTEITFVNKSDIFNTCDKRAIELWPKEVLDYLSS